MERSPNESLRQCPTRRDGAEVLIAQTVTPAMCQDRQRGLYHKCWTCIHRQGAAVARPAPVLRMTTVLGRPNAEAV